MRHLGSLALSLVLGPAVWLLTGLGLSYVGEERSTRDQVDIELLLGVAALVVAGGLYALLALTRLSPIGPALIGLAFLGLGLWSALDRTSFLETVPNDVLGRRSAVVLPAEAFSLLLAVPLLATVFSERRWRRHEYAVLPAATYAGPVGGYAGPPPYPGAASAYPSAGLGAIGFPGPAHPAARPAGPSGAPAWSAGSGPTGAPPDDAQVTQVVHADGDPTDNEATTLLGTRGARTDADGEQTTVLTSRNERTERTDGEETTVLAAHNERTERTDGEQTTVLAARNERTERTDGEETTVLAARNERTDGEETTVLTSRNERNQRTDGEESTRLVDDTTRPVDGDRSGDEDHDQEATRRI